MRRFQFLYIWTKFGRLWAKVSQYQHAVMCQIYINLKIEDVGGSSFQFQKNVNNSGSLHQSWWAVHHDHAEMNTMTKSRNRKLLRVTLSSNERLEHKCVHFSGYNRYLNQIWYRAQATHYQHTGMYQIHITRPSAMHLKQNLLISRLT